MLTLHFGSNLDTLPSLVRLVRAMGLPLTIDVDSWVGPNGRQLEEICHLTIPVEDLTDAQYVVDRLPQTVPDRAGFTSFVTSAKNWREVKYLFNGRERYKA